jgi:hypothetical protein
LDIPKEERRSRVLRRNREKGESYEFEVSLENFEFMETWFEQPTLEEMKEGILISD